MSGRHLRLWTAISTAAVLILVGCGFDAEGAAPGSGDASVPSTNRPSTDVESPTDTETTEPSTTVTVSPTTAPTVRTTSRPAPDFTVPVLPPGVPVIANAYAPPSGVAALTVTDVLVESHIDGDRVVYVFDGNGTPGWSARYVDTAIQDGSGAAVDVPGETVLEVALTGTGYPFDTGIAPYAGPNPRPGVGMITQVRLGGVFEGVTQSFIGLATAPRPASVSLLTDPMRVVVDIEQ